MGAGGCKSQITCLSVKLDSGMTSCYQRLEILEQLLLMAESYGPSLLAFTSISTNLKTRVLFRRRGWRLSRQERSRVLDRYLLLAKGTGNARKFATRTWSLRSMTLDLAIVAGITRHENVLSLERWKCPRRTMCVEVSAVDISTSITFATGCAGEWFFLAIWKND